MNNEREFLEKAGATNIEFETLINNYYIRFDFNGKRHTVKHVSNVYGVKVDVWELLYEENGKTKYKEFRTLEKIITFLKSNEDEENEIIKELKKASYDFIANNYYKLSKEQLKDILLEYIYVADKDTEEEAIENIEERWEV